jgi:RNA polymerase sigma-70 factor (ECF subfamily)
VQDSLVGARSEVERIFREHGEHMLRTLLAFSGDPELAREAVAEALAQALRRGTALRDPLAWTWRAAFKIARGELKRRRTEGGTAFQRPYEIPEPAVDLVAALRSLSPSQRAAIVLHHVADRPVREVATILGMSQTAVRVHLSRGRRRLREELEASDD